MGGGGAVLVGVGVSPESARSYQDQVDTVPGVLWEARLALAFITAWLEVFSVQQAPLYPQDWSAQPFSFRAQSDSSLLSPDWQNQKNIAEELLWASF